MLYKEMLLIGEDYDYFIEMDPAGNGIRFMRVGDDDIRKWVAAIIDTGGGDNRHRWRFYACHALGARHSYEKAGS